MATAEIAPPPGFEIEDAALPEGFEEEVAPPEGFELETPTSQTPPDVASSLTPVPVGSGGDAPVPTASGDAVAKPGWSFNGKAALDALLSPFNDFTAAAEGSLPSNPRRDAERQAGRLLTSEQAQEQIAGSKEAMQTPIVTIPKPEGDTVMAGIGRGAAGLAEGLTTGENLILLASMAGAPAVVHKAAAAGFGGMMATEIPGQIERAGEATSTGDKAQAITELVGTAAMTALAAKQVAARSPIKAAERAASMEQAKAAVEAQRPVAPLTAQAVAESMPKVSEALAGSAVPPTERTPATPKVEQPSRPVGDGTPALVEAAATASPESISKNAAASPETPTTETLTAPRASTPDAAKPTTPAERGAAAPSRVVELLPEEAVAVKKSGSALGFAATSKPTQWLVDNVKRLATAEGDLPREVFDRWSQRNAEVKGITREIVYNNRDLYDAVAKEFGITKARQFTKGFQDVPPAEVKKLNAALAGEIPMDAIPERIREPLQKMRQQIDQLSQRMLDEGLIDGELAARVEGNLGTYLTRSYRVFDDPQWSSKVPQEVRNRASSFLLGELKKNNPAATEVDAVRLMNSMLQDWQAQAQAKGGQGGKVGAKDLSILIKRKDIAPEIRALMGQYDSPAISYARSVSKMASLLGSQKFLADVRAMGEGKWLFKDGAEKPGFSAKIAAEGSDVMAPLNGMRTTPEIAAAFAEFGKIKQSDSVWSRAFFTATAAAKGAKTVGSIMTQARNLFGQVYFWSMNGHFDLRPLKEAVMGTAADIGLVKDAKWRDFYKKMVDLGVVDQSAKAGELRDALIDAKLNDANLAEFGDRVLLKNLKKSTVDAAIRGYQLSDDLGKMVGFANESARLKDINPEWTPRQIEMEAAKRVRELYPTYSEVPQFIKQFQRQPFFGPFTSFAAEAVRTFANSLKYTARDLRSANPKARKAGAQRLAGQMAVLGGGFALSAVSRALLGIRSDEEQDAQRFLPKWDKNSQLLYTAKEDGKLSYINLSFANPYSFAPDTLNAFINGMRSDDDIATAAGNAFGKLISPFTSENIVGAAFLDVARNRTETGKQIYSPGDSVEEKTMAIVKRFVETIEPGTLTRAKKKIIPAFKGEVTPQGLALNPAQEITSELTGVKQQTMDFRQGLGYKGLQFTRDENDAESKFRRVGLRRGTVDPEEATEAYASAETARFNSWKELHKDATAAMRRGVSRTEALTILKEFGVPKKSADDILDGKYVPYSPSREAVTRSGRPLPALVSPFAGKSLAD